VTSAPSRKQRLITEYMVKVPPVSSNNSTQQALQEIDGPPFICTVHINKEYSTQALIDTGCLAYGVISRKLADHLQLPRISISPRLLQSVDKVTESSISEVTYLGLDISGYTTKIYLYIIPKIEEYQLILGMPWLRKEKAILDASKETLQLRGTLVTNEAKKPLPTMDIRPISANSFSFLYKKKLQVFSASLQDIDKALSKFKKQPTDPRGKLPQWILDQGYLPLFEKAESDRLPPHRPGIDHEIILDKNDKGETPEPPWGPLYNMSREELLVLRKTLTDYLDKGFIRVSNSPAAAPVLFVSKPGGGLRFCCDYRALNQLTRKDRYPLPLIQETLNRIGKAKWFTKLDVTAAFHKIRIKEGDEWLTAFRTRFGLFEWLVTPFGLANAPSTFQRYINWTLRDFLDDFASAYIDDILIFTEGSRAQHRRHTLQVLEKLQAAGLQLDIDKCEFEVQSTKYLGFIIEAGNGIRMDPAKVKAIEEWKAPTTVKGVQAFLGFANFYRRFIQDYSPLTAPLNDLTRKDQVFSWNIAAEESFNKLKSAFTTAPILAQFDSDDETILETDSSGYVTGGILSQYKDSVLRPIAFFSQKNSPAECNYEIYDKELLAIIKCLKEWDAELRSVKSFTILTDHKNLEYFSSVRKLTERQMRWQLILSRFNFQLQYRPGKLSGKPDILSRREQDLPADSDERLSLREVQLLPKELIKVDSITVMSTNTLLQAEPPQTEVSTFTQLWEKGLQEDPTYQQLKDDLLGEQRTFSPELRVKVSIAECSVSPDGYVLFRGRKWVPKSEPLRTYILQEIHQSLLTAHPGREETITVVSRQYFWPNITTDIRRFIRNCDHCKRTKAWREQKHGLLLPLPVPSQIWREISMDFIGPLPKTAQGHEYLLVITDRLGKGLILEPCQNMEVETVLTIFLKSFYRYHGIPTAITSDRGPQFISDLWTSICQKLKIKQRLSTAYHPQTDGSTERANAEVERVLRLWVNWNQDDWDIWLPFTELALNGHTSSTTGVSPFFLTHGYHLDPVLETSTLESSSLPIEERAQDIQTKLQAIREWSEIAMTANQQEQEKQANRYRSASPAYKVGDKVWLRLSNLKSQRPNKKLDDKAAKYTVTEVIGPLSYRLDIPGKSHNVFHVDLLRPAASDPFPSQQQSDYQPPPVLEDRDELYFVDEILQERIKRLPGRNRSQRQYLVKWTGYQTPTWEPEENLEHLDTFKDYKRAKRGGVVTG
jgi:transposase InsO family protein/predicted aspartyl protease